jgi:outer membrane protein W
MRTALLVFAAVLCGAVAASATGDPVVAPEEGFRIEAGAQHVIAMTTGDTGALDVEPGRGFGAFVEVFWREGLSTRAAATFVNPAAILYPESSPSNVDLGTLGLDVYSATARWHLAPRSRISAYAGGGGAFVLIGNLEDRFGSEVEIDFDPELTFVAEGGLRYRFRERIFVELGVTYLPLEGNADVRRTNVTLPETFAFDPLIVSAGAAWRF